MPEAKAKRGCYGGQETEHRTATLRPVSSTAAWRPDCRLRGWSPERLSAAYVQYASEQGDYASQARLPHDVLGVADTTLRTHLNEQGWS
jgi:hypothetical protein